MDQVQKLMDNIRKKAVSDKWIALIIFFYAFSIRFKFRSADLFHMDSVGYSYTGELIFKTQSMHYAHFPGHPGVVLINAAFYGFLQLFGFDSGFTTIFVSVLFGAMAAPMFYLICIKLGFPRTYALYTGIIMIFFPLQWSLSEYLPTDVEALFFLLAALYLALSEKRISLFFSSFFFVVSVAIKLENIFLLPFFLGLWIINLHYVQKKSLSKLTGELIFPLLIIIFGLFLLYGPYIPIIKSEIDDPARIAFVQVRTLSEQLGDAFVLLQQTFSFTGIILILLGIIEIFFIRKQEYEDHTKRIIMILLFLSLFIILFSASIPLRDYDRYILSGFSLLMIFLASGLKLLGNIDKHIPPIIVILLLIYMVQFTLPIVSARHTWAGQKEFASNIKGLVVNDSAIVALDEGAFIYYYTNLSIIGPNISNVEKLLGENMSVYMVESVNAYEEGQKFISAGREKFDFIALQGFFNEDWHGRALNRKIFYERIYRIELRRE